MGWTFTYGASDKKKFIGTIIRDLENSPTSNVLAHRVVGNNLWVALADKKFHNRFIYLFRLAKHDGDWGYKDIDENMGPVEVNCPMSLIKMTAIYDEGRNEWARKWRERVTAYHAAKTKKVKLTIGDAVTVRNALGKYIIVSFVRRSARIQRTDIPGGLMYRCSTGRLERA